MAQATAPVFDSTGRGQPRPAPADIGKEFLKGPMAGRDGEESLPGNTSDIKHRRALAAPAPGYRTLTPGQTKSGRRAPAARKTVRRRCQPGGMRTISRAVWPSSRGRQHHKARRQLCGPVNASAAGGVRTRTGSASCGRSAACHPGCAVGVGGHHDWRRRNPSPDRFPPHGPASRPVSCGGRRIPAAREAWQYFSRLPLHVAAAGRSVPLSNAFRTYGAGYETKHWRPHRDADHGWRR